MESDSVRTSGDSVVVDMWIEGRLRSISVSRAAIETYLQLPPDRAASFSEDERREFVRTHLGLVTMAAANRLRGMDPGASSVRIEARQLGGRSDEGAGDRRQGERRRGDRREGDRRAPTDARRQA